MSILKNLATKKVTVKSVLKECYYAKAMAFVLFYLSAMCSIIALTHSYSFNTISLTTFVNGFVVRTSRCWRSFTVENIFFTLKS